MIELIRSWLIGVTCAAAIVALAERLTPAGTVRKIGKLTGGLVLLLALLRPIMGLDMDRFSAILTSYQVDLETSTMDLGVENALLMKNIIEQETGAYILDKAQELGIQCEVEVHAQAGEAEGECPIPYSVTIRGPLSPEQRSALTRYIEAQLAIPEQRQQYEGEEVE